MNQARFLAENMFAISFAHIFNEKEKQYKRKKEESEKCCENDTRKLLSKLVDSQVKKAKRKQYEVCDSENQCGDLLECVQGICISAAEKIEDKLSRHLLDEEKKKKP